MRRLVLGAAAVTLVLGTTAAPASGTARHQCRQQWSALAGLHGENGNPGGPVPTLTDRWDGVDAVASSYAHHATGRDCGPAIDAYAAAWDQLESFMYDLGPYDPLGRLEGAEGNRQHALGLSGAEHLSHRLERQFRIARHQAPRAAADLAPALAPAATLDVTDPVAVQAELDRLAAAADVSRAERRLDRALRVIGDAELDEE